MAFINDYLSDEEEEMFKKLNISYPAATGITGIIGCSPNTYLLKALKRTCTIDRNEKLYFFYCGTEQYDMENIPNDHYFYLLWNKELGDKIVTIVLEKIYKSIDNNQTEHIIFWKIKKLYIEEEHKKIKELIILKIKEALSVYGIDGEPGYILKTTKVDFDF